MKILKLLLSYWKKFGAILAKINSTIILTILYFILFPFFAIPYQGVLFIKNRKKKDSNFIKYEREMDIKEQF